MPSLPRRQGYLSNVIRDLQEEMRRHRPQRTTGTLTTSTPQGTFRRPIATQRRQAGGTAKAYWA